MKLDGKKSFSHVKEYCWSTRCVGVTCVCMCCAVLCCVAFSVKYIMWFCMMLRRVMSVVLLFVCSCVLDCLVVLLVVCVHKQHVTSVLDLKNDITPHGIHVDYLN